MKPTPVKELEEAWEGLTPSWPAWVGDTLIIASYLAFGAISIAIWEWLT